jgi:hypothetical protein
LDRAQVIAMSASKATRITRTLTAAQRVRLREQRRLIAAELPELVARDRACKEAQDESTVSGELCRAVHASSRSLEQIAVQARIPTLVLDEFLTGERTLRSDVLDRLVSGLRLELVARK